MASFKELNEIGSKIRKMYLEDQNEKEWFNSIIEICSNDEFPPDTFNRIVDYLQSRKDKESEKLAERVLQISQEGEVDNILYPIFYPESPGEEEEEEAPEVSPLSFPDDEESENQDLSIPQNYFDNLIKEIQKMLNISYDLSYLLLKKYNWDKVNIPVLWIQSQGEVLSNLKVKLDKKLFPSTKDPISAQPCEEGVCSICYDDTDIYQLYCGHQFCKECLKNEIIYHIKNGNVPICRTTDEEGTVCNAEIIPPDVEKFVEDTKILDTYNKILLRSKISSCTKVRECPNCHVLITSANDMGCHTAKCPHCNFATCLNCIYPGSHAPLINCDHINDFTITLKNKMAMLDQAQKLWYLREERLKGYRKANQGDPTRYFDGLISDARKKLTEETEAEIANIRNIAKVISENEDKLSKLIIEKRNSTTNQTLENQITELQKELKQKYALKDLLEKTNRVNVKDRDHYMRRIEKLKTIYFWAVTEVRHPYQYGIVKFKNKVNRLVSQKLTIPVDLDAGNENETSAKITKECPHCHTTIFKQGGCNYVYCENCKHEFCWVCNQPWVPPHGDHFFCPNYSLSKGLTNVHVINGIDYKNPKDVNFYPMPLDPVKKVEFVKYNNSYMEYSKNKDKYDELAKEFLKNSDETTIRRRLIKSLLKENGEKEAEKIANRFLNMILLAQSVIAWSYAELYYIQKQQSYDLFEYKISLLEKTVDDILKLLSDYNLSQSTTNDIKISEDIIKNGIDNILISAETL